MKHNFKKILSFFLAALMCLSTFPLVVFAEDTATEVMPACPTCLVNTAVSRTGRVNEKATCTEAAGEWFVCATVHNDNTPQEFIKPYGKDFHPEKEEVAHHSNPEHAKEVKANAATCVATGNKAYWYCDVCNGYYATKDMVADKMFGYGEKGLEAATIAMKSEHTFDFDGEFAWKDGKAPVCGESGGVKIFTCTVDTCTATTSITVEAVDHEWKHDSHDEIADCLTDTTVTEKCALCGETREVLGKGWKHSLVKTDATRKTCTTAGNRAYYTCVLCGDYYMDAAEDAEGAFWATYSYVVKQEIGGKLRDVTYYVDVCVAECVKGAWIVPASHEPVKMGGQDATCLDDGAAVYYDCSVCDKYFSDKACTVEIEQDSWIIPATGHNVVLKDATDATCVATGNTAYYDCTGCDLYFAALAEGDTAYTAAKVLLDKNEIEVKEVAKDSWVLPALGHKFGNVQPAFGGNCTAQGTVAYKTCSVCELNFAPNATVDATDDLKTIYATVMVPNPAFNPLTDALDKALVPSGTVGALELGVQHKWKFEIGKNPTCELSGSVVWSCENCDAYTGADKHVIYDLAPTYHSAIDTTGNNWYTPAEPGDNCKDPGTCAYVQCPDCNKYLVVAFDEDGKAYIVNPKTGAYDSLVSSVFDTETNTNVHVGLQFSVAGETPSCFETTIKPYKVCMSCYMAYMIDAATGEKINSVQLPKGLLYAREELTDAYFNFACGEGVFHAAADMDEIACGESYGPAYYQCPCGKIYGAVEDENGELTVDEKVTYGSAPRTVRNHDYEYVPATFNCLNDGKLAHYVCKHENCGKKFLYIKVAGVIDQYVEVTDEDLAQEATGQHDFVEVYAATPCRDGAEGVPGLEKCSVCKLERAIDPHTYNDRVYHDPKIEGIKEPTCNEVGYYALKCDFCQTYKMTDDGSAYEISVAEKKLHTDFGTPVFVPHKDSTCFAPGNEAYYQCNGCKLKFPTAAMRDEDVFTTTVIPPDTNVEVKDGKVDVSLGVTIVTTYKNGWEVIPASHKNVQAYTVPEEDRVCGISYKAQYTCTDCNYYSLTEDFAECKDTPYVSDDATLHTGALIENRDFAPATCLAAGHQMTYTCQGECGKTYIKDADFNFVEATEENVIIAQLSHNGRFMPAVAPTCTTQGWKAWYQVCKNGCNKIYGATDPNATDAEKAEVDTTVVYDLFTLGMIIPLLGHVQTEANTKPYVASKCDGLYSVTDGQIAHYTCDRCGKMFADGDTGYLAEELNENTVKAIWYQELVHHQTATVVYGSTVLNTCTTEGYFALECTCGYTYYQFTAPVGHDIVSMNKTKIEATCSTWGLEEYYFCANCKTSYKDRACTEVWKSYMDLYEDAAGFAAYNDACIEPTGKHVNIVDGVKVEIVPGCYNGAFVEKVDADGNIYWIEVIADRVCDECGADFMLPHKMVSGHVDQSCSYPESDYQVCAICHVIDENTRVVIGEKDPDKHGTLIQHTTEGSKCTDSNRFYDVCPLCNEQVGDPRADDDHDYVEYDHVDATCGVNGTQYVRCSKCGDEQAWVLTAPDAHKFEGAVWTDVKGLENDYTSDKAEVRECTNGCGEVQYRAHQDVNFSVELDSAIKAGAALVNSGKLAVTVKMSAYQLKANYFTFSFEYSDNLIFDSVVFSDTAKAFGQCDAGTKVENGANVFTLNTFRFAAADFDINGQDIVYATVYFVIADNAYGNGAKAEIKNLKVLEIAKVDGTPVEATVGADAAEDILMLGDMNDDGKITAADMRLIANLATSNGYDARADVDKTGSIMPVDVTATQKHVVSVYDYAQLIHPENR